MASQQQQSQPRPWLRIASMSRPTAPAPAPQAPRPPFIRPAFTQPFVTPTTQPPPATATATVSSLPTSPLIKTPTPIPSPKTSPPTLPIASLSGPRVSAPSSTTPKLVLTSPPPPPPTTTTTTTINSSVPTSPLIKTPTTIASTKPSPPPPSSTTLPISSSSVPSSLKKIISAPSSSLPTSPVPKPVAPSPVPATTTTVKPLVLASPPPAKTKPLTPPPSPLKLPSAQFKSDIEPIEQKTILVQETIEKPKVVPTTSTTDLQRHIGENHSPGSFGLNGKRDVIKGNGDYPKNFLDSDEFGMRVITIAGENKGAIMKHDFGANPRILNEKGNGVGEEGRLKSKARTMAASSPPPLPLNAYMNSNVQGVNNSILFNGSFTHHDPGVHLSLCGKANVYGSGNGNGIHIKERKHG